MAVCYNCGKAFNHNVNARSISSHVRECEKKNGKKKRFSYVPVERRVAESSASQQPPVEADAPDLVADDLPDLAADVPNLPGIFPPDDGPPIPQLDVLQPHCRRLPAKFTDHVISLRQFRNVSQLQADDMELEQEPTPELPSETPPPTPQPDPVTIEHDTAPNSFGVFRRYFGHSLPSRDSDKSQAIDYGCDASTFDNVQQAEEERGLTEADQQQTTPQPDEKPPYYPTHIC